VLGPTRADPLREQKIIVARRGTWLLSNRVNPSQSSTWQRFFLRLLSLGLFCTALLAVVWAFLALVYAFPIHVLRWPCAAALAALATVAALRLRRHRFGPAIACLACSAPVFFWWLSLTPHNARRWQPDMENTPWAEISGDTVTLHNFRHYERRTADDFTPRWETRTFSLSALRHLDFYMVYWGSPHICHTMMTFDFGTEGRVCASIEARREHDETYSPLAGAFRQYELLYVLGDERDLVRSRTPLQPTDQVYLFRLTATPEIVRAIFLDYLKACDALRTRPAWYHSLTSNCSTLIRKHVSAAHPDAPWDWRILANGHLDKRLYELGHLDRSLPLAELKARSLINSAARAASDAPDFSDRIRQNRIGF
jgi:hypothetical protein